MGVALYTVEMLREIRPGPDCPLRVVDARPHAAYLAGHIPGALHLAWEDWCAPGPMGDRPITAQTG
jgi:3-mercaptopyruvate sulfurtransferase SseA